MCNHTSHHAWFHGSHEKWRDVWLQIFFYDGDLKLDNIDTFTRAVNNLYVTMDACNVWLLWFMHGATYGYYGIMHGATYGYHGNIYGATYD